MDKLPIEIIRLIITWVYPHYTNVKTICNLMCTNKNFNKICNEKQVWGHYYRKLLECCIFGNKSRSMYYYQTKAQKKIYFIFNPNLRWTLEDEIKLRHAEGVFKFIHPQSKLFRNFSAKRDRFWYHRTSLNTKSYHQTSVCASLKPWYHSTKIFRQSSYFIIG